MSIKDMVARMLGLHSEMLELRMENSVLRQQNKDLRAESYKRAIAEKRCLELHAENCVLRRLQRMYNMTERIDHEPH